MTTPSASIAGLLVRCFKVVRASWDARAELSRSPRTPLEREFLPAALEILETPPPVLPRAIMWTISAALVFTLAWATLGRVDVVAVAPGKVIAAGKAKVIQPSETAIIKAILVADGQTVRAGQVLLELEAAATATAAETARTREALVAARLEAARWSALATMAHGASAGPTLRPPPKAPKTLVAAEARAMEAQYHEHRAKLASIDAEIAKRAAEAASAEELVAKLAQTVPIARRRAQD